MKYWEYGIAIFNFYSGVFFKSSPMLENNLISYESHPHLLEDLETWMESQNVLMNICGDFEGSNTLLQIILPKNLNDN